MPNYTKLEKEILTPGQVALVAASRAPAIGALKDAALYRAIAEIEAEMTGASGPVTEGRPGAADLLATALRRLHLERRKRKLPLAPATKAAGQQPAGDKPSRAVASSAARRA
ncbi:MAG: hypothetical protein NZ734_14395, partial [Paracoccus sp.]|nr:hypothetical protein [Paracoccus sp. (in: a-proteobacteria)]